MTSEVTGCAAKDDTEVEVVTYLLCSLAILPAHVPLKVRRRGA